jgi:Ni,Fe-hydrogenase I large subunit
MIAELKDNSDALVFVVRRCGICDFSSIHPST